MEQLLELNDVVLYPAKLNQGKRNQGKYSFYVIDEIDGIRSLPIFTCPSDSIVSKENSQLWTDSGIRPVLPRTEDLGIRISACEYIFAAFTLDEVKSAFLDSGKRSSRNQFRVCIDEVNGHNVEVLNVAFQLKKVYGNQINIMAGNIANPDTYIEYCKAGIDYVRVGIASSSLVMEDQFGFYYPMGSLLLDIVGKRNTACTGLKHSKIIADGGITSQVDILKALALGADYVMCGREFVKLVDAAGNMFRKEKSPDGQDLLQNISRGSVQGMTNAELKELQIQRRYSSDNIRGGRSETVRVSSTLDTWLKSSYILFSDAFMWANAITWTEFKQNIRWGKLQRY